MPIPKPQPTDYQNQATTIWTIRKDRRASNDWEIVYMFPQAYYSHKVYAGTSGKWHYKADAEEVATQHIPLEVGADNVVRVKPDEFNDEEYIREQHKSDYNRKIETAFGNLRLLQTDVQRYKKVVWTWSASQLSPRRPAVPLRYLYPHEYEAGFIYQENSLNDDYYLRASTIEEATAIANERLRFFNDDPTFLTPDEFYKELNERKQNARTFIRKANA